MPPGRAPTIDLIYDDECPNVDAARTHLRMALAGAGLPPVWAEHRIGDRDLPERARGFGSPTVLVEGRDVAGATPGPDHCCRVYDHGARAPSVELIVDALDAAVGA